MIKMIKIFKIKKESVSALAAWIGICLGTIFITFRKNLYAYYLAAFDLYSVYLIILVLNIVLLIWGLKVFLCAKIGKLVKIIALFLILFPCLLRITFGTIGLSPSMKNNFEQEAKEITQTAIETKNSQLCLTIGVGDNLLSPLLRFIFSIDDFDRFITPLQENCVTTLALNEKDESFCDVLPLSNNDVISIVFFMTPSHKEVCYTEIAKTKKDFSVCKKLEEQIKEQIEEKIKQDSYLSPCYQAVYIASENVCNYDDEFGQYDDCIKNLAIEKKDIQICKGVVNWSKQKECEKEILIFTEDFLTSCQRFNGEEKEECIKDAVIANDDIALCDILEDFYKGECYAEIIINGKRNDSKLCDNFYDSLKKEVCLAEVAVNKNDINMCQTNSFRNICYIGIALKKEDPAICNDIKRNDLKTDCFTRLAIEMDKVETCNLLKLDNKENQEDYRQQCINNFYKKYSPIRIY